jgi:hypothetical protein
MVFKKTVRSTEYLDLNCSKQEEAGENSLNVSFVVVIPCPVLSGRISKYCDGTVLWHAGEEENCIMISARNSETM